MAEINFPTTLNEMIKIQKVLDRQELLPELNKIKTKQE